MRILTTEDVHADGYPRDDQPVLEGSPSGVTEVDEKLRAW